ncbi:MFS general substrate transporter [Dacryopinax primogenitus]|uniref:MFS general substrate transporter n=1 Tax=Dacryopinax primogenitus (strain DJM 731) TaxID=1858805 RepID=M5FNW6_DACPD|nr:MFS general substrate transporter [Dacryopinax primogenitus]EJT98005.1 MFS general substrate transporter [Dacryopinax primogenitus]
MVLSTSRTWLLIGCVCGANVLNNFLQGALTVSLSTIQQSLNISEPNLQWCLSAYALTFACFLLLSGKVADVLGRRLLFVLGTAWIAILSIAASFSRNQISFIVLNGLMGLGAAANTPAGIGILGSTLSADVKSMAFAAVGGAAPIGYITGLCLGGILCETFASWPSVFWIESALATIFSLMSWFCIPSDRGEQYHETMMKLLGRIDWVGASLSTLGFATLIFSLTDAQSAPGGWSTPYIPVLLVLSVILLLLFFRWEVYRERTGAATLMPPSLFKSPNFGMILSMVFCAWWAFNAMTYFATIYYQLVLQLSPIQTALRLLPLGIAGVGINTLAGYLISRMRPVWLIALGLIGSLAAPLLFAFVQPSFSYWWIMFWVMLFIVGPDAAYAVSNIHISAAVPAQDQALAGGIFNVTTRLATALGIATSSAVATAVSNAAQRADGDLTRSPSALLSGYHAAAWVCFGIAMVAMVIDLVGLRGLPMIRPSQPEQAIVVSVELQPVEARP